MQWKKSFQEFVFSLTSNDKYSDFDSKKSFNRINTPESEQLYSHHYNQHQTDNLLDPDSTFVVASDIDGSFNKNTYEGIHETKLAWRHISNWLSNNAPDLKSLLQSPCTDSDIQEFQKDLGIRLPNCVIEFYKLTDGQTTYNDNGSGGLIFGLKLLPLEEIAVLTENWRKVAKTLQTELSQINQNQRVSELSKVASTHSDFHHASLKKFSSSASAVDLFNHHHENSSNHQLISPINASMTSIQLSVTATSTDILPPLSSSSYSAQLTSTSFLLPLTNAPKKSVSTIQRCIPPGKIHLCYSHHMWIPIITDEVGNCIGLDLAPVDKKDWGQVILFGREFDTKFKIADNFGDFLILFANDLEKGNWELKSNESLKLGGDLVVGSDEELVFISKDENSHSPVEVPYLEMLKRRSLKSWIDSLGKVENDLTPELEVLIKSIRDESRSILADFTWKQLSSIDDVINRHLTLIDKINEPINNKVFITPPTSGNKETKNSTLKVDTGNSPPPEPKSSVKSFTSTDLLGEIVPEEIIETDNEDNDDYDDDLHNIPI